MKKKFYAVTYMLLSLVVASAQTVMVNISGQSQLRVTSATIDVEGNTISDIGASMTASAGLRIETGVSGATEELTLQADDNLILNAVNGNITTNKTINGTVARAMTNTTNSITPVVGNLTVVFLDYSGVPVIITDLINGVEGQCVTLISADGLPEIFDGGSFRLNGNWTPEADDTITLCRLGGAWYETSRSNN